ncbi:hypothetical protein [Erythrobacter donghaensis]|uniref:hypothetical protein n=1 Tax=Erythrobacter donghaensis TaxID=267135 RepID=UPI00117F2DE0|nr:hypothetical protein [Erythrobacter donghaensis]
MVRFTSLTLLAAAALLASVPGLQAGSIKSGLQIEPGQTFELGGGQRGGFTVTGTNTGPVAVEVLGKAGEAAAAPRATVAPGGKLKADFGPGEMALLRNTSAARTAKLKLTITGDTAALGMGYSANP